MYLHTHVYIQNITVSDFRKANTVLRMFIRAFSLTANYSIFTVLGLPKVSFVVFPEI